MWGGPTLEKSTLKLDRDALDWRKFNGRESE